MNAYVLVSMIVVVLVGVAVNDARADCWDTGCQLNSWAVKGCEQYGRTTTKKRPCSNGFIYTCCSKVSEVKNLSVIPRCIGQTKCLSKKGPKIDGCEPVSKKIVKKMKTRPCSKGLVYSCCKIADDYTIDVDAPYKKNEQ